MPPLYDWDDKGPKGDQGIAREKQLWRANQQGLLAIRSTPGQRITVTEAKQAVEDALSRATRASRA